MSKNLSRRQIMALAGFGALSATGIARAQSTPTSHIFANGIELSWAEPWTISPVNAVAEVFSESMLLTSNDGAEVLVGYYEAKVAIDDALTAMLSLVLGDGVEVVNVAGGSEPTTFEGATVTREFRVHKINRDGQVGSLFAQLTDGVEMKVLFSPALSIAANMASANDSITLDGFEVFADVSGEDVQQALGVAEYTDALGFLHVAYPDSWIVISHDDIGIELANPAETLIFSVLTEPLSGDLLEDVPGWFLADQGPNGVGSTPVVDGNVLTFATDGEYGLRLGQAELVDDPTLVLVLMVRDFEGTGTEATALLEEVRAAILVNGKQPFPGLEAHITEIAPA